LRAQRKSQIVATSRKPLTARYFRTIGHSYTQHEHLRRSIWRRAQMRLSIRGQFPINFICRARSRFFRRYVHGRALTFES